MEDFDNCVSKLSFYALAHIMQFCLERAWGFARQHEPCMLTTVTMCDIQMHNTFQKAVRSLEDVVLRALSWPQL